MHLPCVYSRHYVITPIDSEVGSMTYITKTIVALVYNVLYQHYQTFSTGHCKVNSHGCLAVHNIHIGIPDEELRNLSQLYVHSENKQEDDAVWKKSLSAILSTTFQVISHNMCIVITKDIVVVATVFTKKTYNYNLEIVACTHKCNIAHVQLTQSVHIYAHKETTVVYC